MIFLYALYFGLLPFSFALPFFSGIDLPLARLGAVVLVLAWFAAGAVRGRLFFPLSLPVFFLTGFLLTATLSLAWSSNEGWALRKIIFLWSFIPLFFVLAGLLAEDAGGKIVRAAIWGAVASALLGLAQFLLQFVIGVERLFAVWVQTVLPFFLGGNFGEAVAAYPSLLVNVSGATLMRASAFFPDPHIFAFYVGMLAPLALALGFREEGRRRQMYWMAALLLAIADLLSFSRGGYAGLLGGGLFFGFFYFLGTGLSLKRFFLILFVCVALIGSIAVSPVGPRLLSSFSPTDGSSIERLRLWDEAWSHIGERPLLGTGLGNYPLLVKPSASFREPIYVHNLFLDIAVEIGLVGLFFFVAFFGSIFSTLWKKWRPNHDILPLGLAASLVVYLGHALFEAPIFSVHVLPLLLLITALSVTPLKETKKV